MSDIPELTDDDIELFRSSVGPVEHIPHDLVIANTRKPRPVPIQTLRETFKIKQEMLSSVYDPVELENGDELLFVRPGVQTQVLRKLRRGYYTIESELDLHGMTVDIARQTLARYLATCTDMQFRCIRIIHGKGHGSKDKQPILKVKLNHWLQQRDEVLAFTSARPVDGGTGAVYVLLKRS